MRGNIEGKEIFLNGTRGKGMSKGLEALKQMSYYHLEMGNCIRDLPNYAIIEKSLKALEVIKETRVDINFIKLSKNYDDYCGMEVVKMLNHIETAEQKGITQEEYDLLKEVLL